MQYVLLLLTTLRAEGLYEDFEVLPEHMGRVLLLSTLGLIHEEIDNYGDMDYVPRHKAIIDQLIHFSPSIRMTAECTYEVLSRVVRYHIDDMGLTNRVVELVHVKGGIYAVVENT